MKNAMIKLISVKSILSLICIITLCILTIKGNIDENAFIGLSSSIITYYFTRKEVG